jgi:hypothetical protein
MHIFELNYFIFKDSSRIYSLFVVIQSKQRHICSLVIDSNFKYFLCCQFLLITLLYYHHYWFIMVMEEDVLINLVRTHMYT